MMRLLSFRLTNAFRYGVVALYLFLLLSLYSWDDLEWKMIVFSFVFGVGIGLIHELVIGNRFRSMPTFLQLILELLIIAIITIVVEFSLVWLQAFVLGNEPVDDFAQYLRDSKFYVWMRKFLIIGPFVVFFFQVERLIGKKMFMNWLLGRYEKPRSEERVFMFMDMKDSTTYAEQMSNEQFYDMLNDCFTFMSPAILKTRAEVLKYIGDEVVLTWTLRNGLKRNNCVNLYLEIYAVLKKKEEYFKEKYGVVPFFKAGAHIGTVITAQVGHVKKAIDYSGDTMSTAARIQGKCNDYNAEFLISEKLFDALEESSKLKTENLPELELKGKEERVNVKRVVVA